MLPHKRQQKTVSCGVLLCHKMIKKDKTFYYGLKSVLSEYFTLFQVLMVTNSYFCHTDFAPAGHHTAGHMLEVIVIEKDTLLSAKYYLYTQGILGWFCI